MAMNLHTTRWAALTAATALALAGCSGGGGGDSASEAGGAEAASVQNDSAADESLAGTESSENSARKEGTTRISSPAHIARTAALTITVDDIARASAKVRTTATSAGGYISSEETHVGPEEQDTSPSSPDHAWAQMVVTVPVEALDSTLTALSRLGHVTERTGTTEDLTSQYTDTASRVRTLEKSVKRLQELIDSADGLEEIVALEAQLTQRESDLESMVSQMKALEKRTTTVPITVSLQTPQAVAEDESGFLAGLGAGWDAFGDAFSVGMTALGAVTPFALVALVVLAPVAIWLRRRRAGVSAS